MILKIANDGTFIEADQAGAEHLINGLQLLRDAEPGTEISDSYITADGVGRFRLIRLPESDEEA